MKAKINFYIIGTTDPKLPVDKNQTKHSEMIKLLTDNKIEYKEVMLSYKDRVRKAALIPFKIRPQYDSEFFSIISSSCNGPLITVWGDRSYDVECEFAGLLEKGKLIKDKESNTPLNKNWVYADNTTYNFVEGV